MAEVTGQVQNLSEYENDVTTEDFKEIPLEVVPDISYHAEAIDEQDIHDKQEDNHAGALDEIKVENGPEDPELKKEHENQPVQEATGGCERWPGWPGESVFRMLVPAQKVGGLIGRKGEYIKKITEETKARIKILDGPPGTAERAVMVSAKEDQDASLPSAINGILKVHQRVVDGLDSDSSHPPPSAGSTRLLVPAAQAGSLIGKQGATVKSIQEGSNCVVRVLGTEELPVFALQDDRIVEVVGEPAGVHKAVELVASQLRKYLVDRSIISMIENQMQMPHPPMECVPPPQAWGPPPQGFPPSSAGGQGFGAPHFMPPPRQHENYYPPAEMPPPLEKQTQRGISAYGREPLMTVPLSYADAVIGSGGANISYNRRISGATVKIQESRGAPGEMTVEISGTASQVQTAQQIIQNFMTEAAGQSQSQGGAVDQSYNSYGAQSNMYPPAASNIGLFGQAGGYGSAYRTNYGY